MKRKFVTATLCIVLALGCVSVSGCSISDITDKASGETKEEDETVEVEVVSPKSESIDVETEFMGTMEPKEETEVYSLASGKITDTFFEVGDRVNEGDVLFTIDDEAAQLQLKNAKAAYTTAQVGTTEQIGALQMQRDKNEDSIKTAQEGISQVQDSFNYMEDTYGDVEEKKEDTEDDKDDIKDDIKKVNKNIKKAKEQLEAAEAAGNTQLVEELTETIATLRTQKATLESGKDSYDSAIDTLESSEKEINYNKSKLYYSYDEAVRGAALAQENQDYFDTYTVPGTLQSSQATMEQAQVAVDSAQMQLDYTKVTAPVSGVIEKKNVDKFGMAQAGYTAYVIVDNNTMLADFYVTENVFRNLSIGQAVTVERNGVEYTGKVSELPTTMDSATNLFEIKATVNGTADQLVDGSAIKVKTVTDSVKNVISIPVDCVYYDSEQAYVYVAENGVLKKTYIETGIFNEDTMEVISGLTPDSVVVSSWSAELRDGLKVTTTSAVSENEAN